MRCTRVMNDNDWNSIRVSLRKHNEIVLYRELGSARAEVSTTRASAPWDADMLVSVKYTHDGVSMRQLFETMEDARKNLEEWIQWR